VSRRGAGGAIHNGYFYVLKRVKGEAWSERRKQARLEKRPPGDPISVALNQFVVSRERSDAGEPGRKVILQIKDAFGSLGALVFDGARLVHWGPRNSGTNSLFPYVVEQINHLKDVKGRPGRLDIVEWSKLGDEETEKYLALTIFARRLEIQLKAEALWPTLELTSEDCDFLARKIREICPAIRAEAFLPQREYAGEHKLPIVPEPLGIISLSRTEKRVDPVASMTSVLVTVFISLAILLYVVLQPPWVPGK
jgi:hypothetical protein